jgi:hypothetical protein
MTRPVAMWLLLVVAPWLMAGCGAGEPPRMGGTAPPKPDSIEVKDKLPKTAKEKLAK